MLVDHLFQCWKSPWSKTAEKHSFCTGVMDGPTDGPTDRPSYRDAFLTEASKNYRGKTGDLMIGKSLAFIFDNFTLTILCMTNITSYRSGHVASKRGKLPDIQSRFFLFYWHGQIHLRLLRVDDTYLFDHCLDNCCHLLKCA